MIARISWSFHEKNVKKALEEGGAGDYCQTQIRFRKLQNKSVTALGLPITTG